ncbi:unnamed protein product [Meloidogyne enterolobii]|uniref:Uncharacterized protein n=1 Tax=Meloidogyne enterolobii TaxID=390850 RepID=A0ACB1AFD0_MELEN
MLMNMDMILKSHPGGELNDDQKSLLEMDEMKEKMIKGVVEILNLIYTKTELSTITDEVEYKKNEALEEYVKGLLEERIEKITKAEIQLNKAVNAQKKVVEELKKQRETFLSIRNFMNDYNQAVEQIVLFINKERVSSSTIRLIF